MTASPLPLALPRAGGEAAPGGHGVGAELLEELLGLGLEVATPVLGQGEEPVDDLPHRVSVAAGVGGEDPGPPESIDARPAAEANRQATQREIGCQYV